ncbi:DUF2256 domain-containing protein [Aurantimicrobium minutum]|uniref:DUF2256 domain-containing protein n=1 Tax=Aurantimicrobium minutum TaxID=708131 RepID=UPI00247410B0|nr:DUF2256 domain-containing protein [Aurantimicrobium minutum]MDH6238688.1 hypothetical protein [Aurantimicrobium minutum]
MNDNSQQLLNYIGGMPRTAQTKNGFAPKVCESCGLPFEWRKKWAREWENVKYCSEKCRRTKGPHQDG